MTVFCSPRRVSASAHAFASFHLHRPGRTWSGFSSLAGALPPFRSGGCFAAVVVLVQVVSGGCFAAVVVCSGGYFATFFRLLTFAPWSLWFLLAGSVVGFWLEEWVVSFVFSVLLCCCSCCRCVFLFVCTFFQYFSIFSPLCSCVGQALLGHIKLCL